MQDPDLTIAPGRGTRHRHQLAATYPAHARALR
jgi:hypothetical protein